MRAMRSFVTKAIMRLRNQVGILVFVAGLLTTLRLLFSGFTPPELPGGDERWIQVESARSLDDTLWIDARDQEAYQKAHVPGALSLNPNNWESRIGEVLEAWQPGQPIVVYCDGGACKTSSEVASILHKDYGFEDVYVLKNGWEAWQQHHDR